MTSSRNTRSPALEPPRPTAFVVEEDVGPVPRFARGTHEQLKLEAHELEDTHHEAGPVRTWEEHMANTLHDLRNPLSNIGIELYLIEAQLRGVDAPREAIERVRENLAYMQRLLDELQDDAPNDDITVRITPNDLRALLQAVCDRVATAMDRGRVYLDAPVPVLANVDQHGLERVITNLVQNALAYAPAPAKIIIRLERHGYVARISVIDRGRGIARHELGSVFDRHRRASSSNDCEGEGLGLYICRKIVEAHGGNIEVESDVGRGSRFIIELPL